METIDNLVKGRSLNELATVCHGIAREKGFWDEERNIGEALMLIVTELAEAMEAHRKQDEANFQGRAGRRLYPVAGPLWGVEDRY